MGEVERLVGAPSAGIFGTGLRDAGSGCAAGATKWGARWAILHADRARLTKHFATIQKGLHTWPTN